MNHAISINSDKTLVITLPEGTQVDRVMIRKMGTQESKLYWRDEVLDQYKWERDIAIQQLKELGYGFGQEPKTDGDTISRQAVIKELRKRLDADYVDAYDFLEFLKRLPSVTPKLANNSKELERKNGELISRQEAIEAVLTFFVEYLGGAFYEDEQVILKERIKQLPSVQPEPKWIPCSERLPEGNGQFLISTRNWIVYVAKYAFGKWQGFFNKNCIAWMPLPEPYREDGEKK